MSADPIRVLVVDDASLYRKLLSNVLAKIDGVQVVGTANNGTIALAKIAQCRPDLLTLDMEMPAMDGLETLRRLRDIAPQVGVIMVSAHTKHGARVTMEALELGALDFITKPEGNSLEHNVADLRRQLHVVLSTFRTKKQVQSILRNTGGTASHGPAAGTSPVAMPLCTMPRTASSVCRDWETRHDSRWWPLVFPREVHKPWPE